MAGCRPAGFRAGTAHRCTLAAAVWPSRQYSRRVERGRLCGALPGADRSVRHPGPGRMACTDRVDRNRADLNRRLLRKRRADAWATATSQNHHAAVLARLTARPWAAPSLAPGPAEPV